MVDPQVVFFQQFIAETLKRAVVRKSWAAAAGSVWPRERWQKFGCRESSSQDFLTLRAECIFDVLLNSIRQLGSFQKIELQVLLVDVAVGRIEFLKLV